MDSRREDGGEGQALIREAFARGANVEVINATRPANRKEAEELYVAAYCRVSTLTVEQADSYEMQKQTYTDLINNHEHWNLYDIYADKGKSATSVYRREHFLRLMEDCKKGGIDLIITKSISRFARNIIDCLTYTRMLKALPHPVGVFFEADNINTLDQDGETMLGILAGFAQRESEDKSKSIKWGIRHRFEVGIPKFTRMYGYKFEKKTPVIVEKEAEVVKHIYSMFLEGYSISAITAVLNVGETQTLSGKPWNYSGVHYILTNERYCGQVLMQKTVTVDMFRHKSVVNRGLERQYRVRDYHTAIISGDEWEEVQLLLGARGRFSSQNSIVELSVPIETSNILDGFQQITVKEKLYEH